MKYIKYFERQNDIVLHHTSTLIGQDLPKYVNGDFYCSYCYLTSLEGCSEKINGSFDCSDNNLTSLLFGPKYVAESFNCVNNNLTSLDYLPEYIGGFLFCNNNNLTNPISYKHWLKYHIYDNSSYSVYTKEQLEKFGSYEFQKDFLTNTPEKYKDLEHIGFNDKIKDEFDWLFNAIDMGLM